MTKALADQALAIIQEMAQGIVLPGWNLNERHLHHFFTFRLQQGQDLLALTKDDKSHLLHPEWPTSQTGALYATKDERHVPCAAGSSGFIDFALGEFAAPDIAVEFCLTTSLGKTAIERITFDYLKLLDANNPFAVALSWSLILGGPKASVKDDLATACKDAQDRLAAFGRSCPSSRKLRFVATEILSDGSRQHWHLLDAKQGVFATYSW